jgi:TfoX/Sxy family transcriptional regulator of competence genes
MAMKPWTRANPEVVQRFQQVAASIEGVELRKMFGYPAAFVGGNMAFGLFEDRIMLRLPEDERATLLAEGWQQFEPMPGRSMREYLTLPADIAADPEQAREWMQKSVDYAKTVPAKTAKKSAIG